jgi:transglutaminase-like putative cysteine protease
MNHDIDRLDAGFDPRISDWLERDPHEAPANVLEAVLTALPAISQRRAMMNLSRIPTTRLAWLGVAAVVVVSVIGGLLAVRDATPSLSEPGAAGSDYLRLATTWTGDGSIALTIRHGSLNDGPVYWRSTTYDRILPTGWQQTDVRTVTRPAGTSLLEGTIDDPGMRAGLRTFTFTVTPASTANSAGLPMVSPANPVSAGEKVRLTLIGKEGFFASMRRDGSTTTEYEVTARTQVRGDGGGELNDMALRAAGNRYPTEIVERYLAVADGILGPNARALQQKIEGAATSRAPIDLVEATMAELRSNEFTYHTDISDLDCAARSTVECFATFKQGFCQYYATTMAVLLRSMGIPARLAVGFLPGERNAATEIVRDSDAHAWVEVYFPGYAWVTFDPTGANLPTQLPPALPAGR